MRSMGARCEWTECVLVGWGTGNGRLVWGRALGGALPVMVKMCHGDSMWVAGRSFSRQPWLARTKEAAKIYLGQR